MPLENFQLNKSCFLNCLEECRGSRKLVIVIVAIALLLDNMLLTTVVPIIPDFLYQIRHENDIRNNITTKKAGGYGVTTSIPPNSLLVEKGNQDGYLEELFNNSTTGNSTLSPEELEIENKHEDLEAEYVEVGVMLSSKAFAQLITNPFIGPLTNKIGYSIPMFAGFIIMFFSTIIFAFGRSYGVLFLARTLQGIGSSCSSVSGMGMLADRYPDDKERGNAMGIALGGLALGVLIGPPFGGIMYQFVGKSAPFLVLAALALGDGLLQLLVLKPGIKTNNQRGASLMELIQDPYIIVASGAITFANIGIATLEPSLPIWMMDTMDAEKWQLGAAFLPASISYLIGTNLFGPLGHKMGRWLASLCGLVLIGICLITIPFARNINHLIVPNAGVGFGIGMVDSSMMPELGYLVDIRHSNVYGSVYAIGDVAFCLGFGIGPALSGSLVETIGFKWVLYGIAILTFLYAPLMVFIRNPPVRDEQKSLLIGEKSSVRYVNQLDEEDDLVH